MSDPATSIWWPIGAGVLIILANAFFVLVEFAVVTVRKGQMDRLAEEGQTGAQQAQRLLKDPDWAIAGSQLGITVASILLGIVAEEPLAHLLEPGLIALLGKANVAPGVATGIGTVVILLLLSFFHMVLGEQTPKTIALRFPAQTALAVAGPMVVFARLASPLVWLVDKSTALVLRVFGVGGRTGGHGVYTVDELKDVVRESQETGAIPYGDEKMLIRAMEFGGRFVREAMIPRPSIVALEKDEPLRELLQTFATARHSRFPVYDDDLDHIVGIVTMKEVLVLLMEDSTTMERSLSELGVIAPALVVPESRRIGDLFAQMRRERRHMAIVIDEFGGTAGLVTSEELAEEVVGRLTDEWVQEDPRVATLEGGAYDIDAQTQVAELNEALQLGLPTSPDYETVAGFLLFEIRRIPRLDEVIVWDGPDGKNFKFTVTEMIGPKIERVRVEKV